MLNWDSHSGLTRLASNCDILHTAFILYQMRSTPFVSSHEELTCNTALQLIPKISAKN